MKSYSCYFLSILVNLVFLRYRFNVFIDNCVGFEDTGEENSSFNPWKMFIFIVLYRVHTTILSQIISFMRVLEYQVRCLLCLNEVLEGEKNISELTLHLRLLCAWKELQRLSLNSMFTKICFLSIAYVWARYAKPVF